MGTYFDRGRGPYPSLVFVLLKDFDKSALLFFLRPVDCRFALLGPLLEDSTRHVKQSGTIKRVF